MISEGDGCRLGPAPTRIDEPWRVAMVEPEAVAAMLRLKELGWGSKRIARELGVNRRTVKRYLETGGWQPYKRPKRQKLLEGLENWLRERLRRHHGNGDVVRQELSSEKGIVASRRTVQRALEPYRQELRAEALATVRFETPPGKQLQIDFGERLVEIGGRKVKVFLFVATLGYSRRTHVRAFRHERQEAWFNGLESTFLTFDGVPEEVLFDNARALVIEHDAQSRTVVFNTKLLAFARHWGFRPRACAPYRARTKGKAENGIAYVKKNAIAGRTFASWEGLEAHLARWEREIANARIHGTTGEVPLLRFGRDEASRLKSIADRPPFQTCRVLERRVRNDCAVEVDGNAYSVPWRLIGEQVEVVVSSRQVRVRHGLREVAVHTLAEGRHHRIIDPTHLAGVAGANGRSPRAREALVEEPGAVPASDLLRPLIEYEAMVGGSF